MTTLNYKNGTTWVPLPLTKAVKDLSETLTNLTYSGAGPHNSIYRGKYLGNNVTEEQWAAIGNGSFTDLYIGDYWTIDDINWRIAAFDYYLNTGDGDYNCVTHHVVIVPDTCLGSNIYMHASNAAIGYTTSYMYTTGLNTAKTIINTAFGAEHILNHRQSLISGFSNSKPSSTWTDSTIELMTEQNVYGSKFFALTSDGTSSVPSNSTIDKSQFPLFALEPSRITIRVKYWLRDAIYGGGFSTVDANGNAGYAGVANTCGVRPSFSIIA